MICKKRALPAVIRSYRASGKKIVFTNGCFDIIHPGHIRILKKARMLGDVLVVGLNSTSSVKSIKRGRPINGFPARAEVLNAIKFVDVVCGFSEKTPEELIKKIKPDVLVKGGDWKESEIAGADFVKSIGGHVRTVPLKKGHSTTALIEKIEKHPRAG